MQTGDTGGRASYLKREEELTFQNKTGHDKITDFKLKESRDHDRVSAAEEIAGAAEKQQAEAIQSQAGGSTEVSGEGRWWGVKRVR